MRSEQFDKGSDWAERKRNVKVERVSDPINILLLLKRFPDIRYCTRFDANARGNRFLLHNSYYSLPFGSLLPPDFRSPSLPLLVPPFTKITYIFISFA